MTTHISTLDALMALRQFQEEDAKAQELIEDLRQQLNNAEADRASRFVELQSKLKAYAQHQSDLHGFGPVLDRLVDAKKSKKPTRQKVKQLRRERPDWDNLLDSTIVYSEREFELVERLKERWPKFTTFEETATEGSANQMASTIYRLRKKGVSIESAQQAYEDGRDIPDGESGYRLIV